MPRVVDKNGVIFALEGDDLIQALQSGQVQLAENVNVRTRAGSAALGPDVSPMQQRLAGPLALEGADEARSRREESYNEDLYGSQNIRAGIEGALSGASFGLSDVALDALGADTEKRAQYNPNIRAGSELAGLLASSIIPVAGEGALAKILAKTPAGFVSAKAAQAGAAIGGIKGAVIAGAAEGATYGAAQTASQLLITDEPLSAEAMWADLGKNAVFGAGLGAAGGLVAGGLSKGFSKLKEARASAPIVNMASEEGQAAADGIAAAVQDIDRVSRRMTGQLKEAVDEVVPPPDISAPTPVEPAPANRTGMTFQEQHLGELKAAGFTVPETATSAQSDFRTRFDTAYDQLRKNKPFNMVELNELEDAFPELSRKKFQAELRKLREDSSYKLRAFEGRHGDLTSPQRQAMVREDGRQFAYASRSEDYMPGAGLADEVVPPVESVPPEPIAAVSAPEPNPAQLSQPKPPPATELLDAQRRAYGTLGVYGDKLPGWAITDIFRSSPDKAARKLTALDDYLTAAEAHAKATNDLRALDDIAQARRSMSDAAQTMVGKSVDGNKLGEIAVGLGLLEVGDSVDGPVGDIAKVAGAAQLVKAGGKGALRKGRSFLNRVSSGVSRVVGGRTMNKLTGSSEVFPRIAGYQVGSKAMLSLHDHVIGQRAIAGVTHGSLERIGAAFGALGRGVSKVARPAALTGTKLIQDARFDYGQNDQSKSGKSLEDAFKDRALELAAHAANPMAGEQLVHDQLAEIRATAPYVADEMEMLAGNVRQFLYDKMPKDPGTMTRMGQSTWKPTRQELMRWGEYVKGAIAPLDAFEEALSGRVTPQAAEAIRSLYPNLFSRMQLELTERLPELRQKLKHDDLVRLSLVFDVPLTSTLRPEFRGFLSERAAIRAQAQAQPKPGAGAGSTTPAPLTGAQQLLH